MDRNDARRAAEVMLAYAEGKEIENRRRGENTWNTTSGPTFDWWDYKYRIKSQPKYRPFNSAEECWQEMQKHRPFGWVKEKSGEAYVNIGWVPLADNEDAFRSFTFADGQPFGVKEEEA